MLPARFCDPPAGHSSADSDVIKDLVGVAKGDLSAASFCIGDAVEEHAIDEYLQCCRPADTRFGVCGVGGAVRINTFKVHDDAPVMPPPPAAPAAPPSVVSDGGMYPVSMLHAHEPDVSFMDKIADGFGLSASLALTRLLLCIAWGLWCPWIRFP
ncbi:hypothetical protein CYMTET_24224 [Cymbomonas tetramitiformis]|uniref:Uncharacterized protein n=1 Tax=Cymbomonas tetramitiformis TaxID=36881 RepID=A0AAE0FWU0_9CHLO|nr:hypothetical protein CYMTET_24224 [Cymbomonas tetramitiformis]